MIVFESEQISMSILFFTVSLGFYFFLSIQHRSFVLLVSLSAIVFSHGLVIQNSIYTLLLLLFIVIIALFKLKEHYFTVFLTINLSLLLFLHYLQDGSMLEMVILSSFYAFIMITLNQTEWVREEQTEMYDQLLAEYRQLKRMNVSAEREARLEERTRIARDIHDSVGHRLTALIMKLEMLAIQNKDTDYRVLKQMAEESLEETREAVQTLQADEHEGIATVVQLIRKLEVESHIFVQFTMKQGVLSVPLTNEKSIALYRVIQEALTNAMRHAQSREVQVILGRSATGDISFEINNQIFSAKPFEFGFGLHNMKKRVVELGGSLDVYQTERQFIVRGTIPSE